MSQVEDRQTFTTWLGSHPLWQQLALLVLATGLPLLLAAWLMFNRMVDSERAGIRRDLMLNARITAALVENEIATHAAIAATLAQSPSLQDGNLPAFWQEATRALEFVPGAWLAVSDPTGQIILNTLAPPGTVLPRHARPDLVQRGFDTRQPQVGDVVFGPVAKRLTAFVEVPVFRDNMPAYSLSISLVPARFHNLIRQQFTHGEVVAIVDSNKKFVARVPDHEVRVGTLASEGWRAAMAEQPEGWVVNNTVEGNLSLTGYTRTQHGWSVGVAMLEADIARPMGKIFWSSAGLAGALSLISIWLVWIIARNATRGMVALAQSARQLAQDQPLPPIQPPFAEAGLIARSLGQTSDELKRRGELLQSANSELEAKVASRTRELTSEMQRRETVETALRQSHKMESIGQLTGGIAHDFNNMLTIVIGNLDTIQRRMANIETAATLQRPVEAALQGARSAARLTHRLLAFSRQQPLEPEALNLNTIVMSLVDLLNRTVGEGIAVETVTGAGLWLTLADANQIENTLLNLAINSRDAMDGQGKLSIETSNAYLDAAYVAQFSDLKAGPYVMLSVTDTGSGIAPDKLERVFEPFYTTKEPGKGTGLGLAMIYGFVKQSGGHVRIYSEVGQGTTVRLYLPRLPESQAVATAPRAMAVDQTPVPQAGAGEVILLVEDDPGVLEYAVGALEDLGYQVVSATGAVEALAKLADVPKLDMLFTDVVLGGQTNGKQLSRLVLEKLPDLPVLFTTGYTRNAIVHQGRLDEGVNLLNKPYSLRELAEKLRFVLSQRQGASAEG